MTDIIRKKKYFNTSVTQMSLIFNVLIRVIIANHKLPAQSARHRVQIRPENRVHSRNLAIHKIMHYLGQIVVHSRPLGDYLGFYT